MAELIPVLTQHDIEKIIGSLAEKISSDYKGREVIFIGVLKGAFIFLADLVRSVTVPAEVAFISASSYGSATVSSGHLKITKDFDTDISGKDVIIVEDIVDSGLTVNRIMDHLKTFQPRSIKVCALIDKRERREIDAPVDYAGHVADSGFLVGFGLDYAEKYRNLPAVFQLNLSQ